MTPRSVRESELTPETLGQALRAARESARLSHHNLARLCKSSIGELVEWENGTRVPTPQAFGRITSAVPALLHLRHPVRALYARVTDDRPSSPRPVQAPLALHASTKVHEHDVEDSVDDDVEVENLAPPVLQHLPFHEALYVARTHERLRQQDVAELVQVTNQAVSAWELGAMVPVKEHWLALQALFPELPEPPYQDIAPPTGGVDAVRVLPAEPPRDRLHPITLPPLENAVEQEETSMSTTVSISNTAIVRWVQHAITLAAGKVDPIALAAILDTAEKDGLSATELAALIRIAKEAIDKA